MCNTAFVKQVWSPAHGVVYPHKYARPVRRRSLELFL
jgi:hypothetical protein